MPKTCTDIQGRNVGGCARPRLHDLATDQAVDVGEAVLHGLVVPSSASMKGMTVDTQRVLAEARKLSPADRAELFERLGAELEAEAADDGLLSQAWRDEIHQRIARIDAGETQLIDADELESALWTEQVADEKSARR